MDISKRIVNKADELFRQYGLRSTGMDAIAESLGMSKKTIYRFYPKKDSLITAFVELEIKANSARCKQVCQKADDAIAELFMLMTAIRDFFARLNATIINDIEKNHTDAHLLLTGYRSVLLADIIDGNLARGVHEQLYRDDINRKLLAGLMLENFMLTINSDFLTGGTIEQWFGYLIGGIVSSKGFATIEIYKNEFEIFMLTGSAGKHLWNH